MLLDIFVLMVAASAAVALVRWRLGIPLAIVIGVLQDPVRKLAGDPNPLLAISSLPVWCALVFGFFRSDRDALGRMQRAYPRLSRVVRLFLLALIPPVLVVLLFGLSAWRVAVFGIFAYVTPLILAVLGFSFIRDELDLTRLLRFYASFSAVMLTGTLLEYTQALPDWPALGTSALGFSWMRFTPEGLAFPLITGFFRSPDLMGWHAAMLMMATLTLGLRRSPSARAWLPLVVWGATCMLMSGRRKALMMPAVWVLVALLAYLRTQRFKTVLSLVVVVLLVLAGFFVTAGDVVSAQYYSYAASTARDAPDRVFEGAVGSVWMTFLQTGFLGRGIGTVAQGMGHIGGIEQGWQESGPSRILAELGVPGFLVAMALAVLVLRACYVLLRKAPAAAPTFYLQVGLIGLVGANAASFLVSHQIYTDLCVMPLSAFFLGAALSGPRWCRLPQAMPDGQASRRATPREGDIA